jgi:hypothetical protein
MQEYKREAARTEERIAKRKEKQADYDDQIDVVETYWNKVWGVSHCEVFLFGRID